MRKRGRLVRGGNAAAARACRGPPMRPPCALVAGMASRFRGARRNSAAGTKNRMYVMEPTGHNLGYSPFRGHFMTTFASPVTVGLPDAEHRIRLTVIDGPRAGLAAMTQHGLGGYRMADMVWQLAFK